MAGKTSASARPDSRSGSRAAPRSGTGSTTGRTPARGSGSGSTRGGKSTAAKPATSGATTTRNAGSKSTAARKPSPPAYEPSPIVTAIKGIGRGLKRLWLLGARWLGGMVRAMGRGAAATKDIDPVHRRDGIAFGLIALAVVCAIGTWLAGRRPGRRPRR